MKGDFKINEFIKSPLPAPQSRQAGLPLFAKEGYFQVNDYLDKCNKTKTLKYFMRMMQKPAL